MESLDTTILNTAVPVVSHALEVAPLIRAVSFVAITSLIGPADKGVQSPPARCFSAWALAR
jgi:hypothetical protein